MRQGEVPFYGIGRAGGDPEIRFTANGKAVANFNIASTKRRFNRDTQQWEDGDTIWVSITVWGKKGEAVANGVQKGDLLMVVGEWREHRWETPEGEKRSKLKVIADEVAHVIKSDNNQNTNNQAGQTFGGSGTPTGDPWANTPPANPTNDSWGSAPQQGFGGGFDQQDDEPPF